MKIILDVFIIAVIAISAFVCYRKGFIKSLISSFGFIAAVLIIGFAVKVFNPLAVVIGMFFPRVAVSMRPICDKITKKGGDNT